MDAFHRCAFCFLLLLGCVHVSVAQSPFEFNTCTDAVLLGGGAGVLLTGQLLKGGTAVLTPVEIALHDRSSVAAFDRAATWPYSSVAANASDALLLAVMISPAALITDEEMQEDAVIIGTMYAESVLLGLALPAVAKGITGRSRPYVYNDAVPMEEKTDRSSRQSFFSGHTTLAFSSAVFLNYVYGVYKPESALRPWLWAGGLTAATTVGILRILAGKHFPSDVVVGATVGSAIGVLVPWLHQRRNSEWSLRVHALPGGASAYLTLHL